MKTINNIENSFVTFYKFGTESGKQQFVTNTECAIQKGFCYPIYDQNDVTFQTEIISDEVLDASNVIASIIDSSGITTISGASVVVEQVGLYLGSIPIYNCHFSFFSSDFLSVFSDGDCFQFAITAGTVEVELAVFIGNECFKVISDKCLTSKLKYLNSSDAFGFKYDLSGTPRYNTIRLPIYFKDPLNPVDREVYNRMNGTTELIWAAVRKSYRGFIDEVPESVHQKLVIAMSHDFVTFVPQDWINVNGIRCVFENEYNQNFPNIMGIVDIWSADFTIFVTPFNNYNSNCG